MLFPLCRVYGYLLTISILGIVFVLLANRSVKVALMHNRMDTGNGTSLYWHMRPAADTRKTPIVVDWNRTFGKNNPYTTTYYPTPTEPQNQGPVPVIILTYMRSGSSFTGQILQAAPSTFYWFEPMHNVLKNFSPNSSFRFLNGDSQTFRSPEEIASLTARSIASCQLERLPVKVLTDGFINQGNNKTSHSFISCLATFRRLLFDPVMALRRCILDYKETCLQSKHVVIKTIRMKMASMENMLRKYPSLKVLHLMRDPRGTVRSQKRYGGFSKTETEAVNTASFCTRVLRDVVVKENLQRRFPNRIKTVFYEEIAQNPITYSKALYQFFGMEFTNESEERILLMTSSGIQPKNCGALCISRPNSSAEAYEWRHQVSIDFVKMVDNACVELYKKIGYKSIPSKKLLLDSSYQLRN